MTEPARDKDFMERLAAAKEKGVRYVVVKFADPWFLWDVVDIETMNSIARFHATRDAMLFITTANFLIDAVEETFRRNLQAEKEAQRCGCTPSGN